MSAPAKNPATYADLEAVPPHLVAEILAGELVTHPRPTNRHSGATTRLSGSLTKFDFDGEDGPGGWFFLIEPQIHLGEHIVVPDLAGWRREKLVNVADQNYYSIAPDWVCEVLSPSTRFYDRGIKRRIYAEANISYYWMLNPEEPCLEVFKLDSQGKWLLVETIQKGEHVQAPPFEAISFPLARLFPQERLKYASNNQEGQN